MSTLTETSFYLAVEDSPATVRFLVDQTSTRVALFSRPWNDSASCDDERVIRVRGWSHLAERFPNP